MAQRRTAPNGVTVVFPDNLSEEKIQSYLSQEKYKATGGVNDWSWDSDRNFLVDMPVQALGGVMDGINSTIGFIEGLGDTLGEKSTFGGISFGEDAENGIMQFKSHDQMVKDGTDTWLFGKVGVKDAIRLPTLDAPDTMVGGFTRGISQFLTGWFTGGKLAKGVATTLLPAKTAIKATQAIIKAPITTALARGSVADILAFDEHQGRMTDVILNYAPEAKDTWLGYLASDPNDTFWEGRMKNAIEGLFLGGIMETVFRSYRYVKVRRDKNNGKKVNEKQLKEDEKFLEKQDIEKTRQADETGMPRIVDGKLVQPSKIRIKGKPEEVQELNFDKIISDNFERFRKGEIDLDESLDLGFNINSFRSLRQDGVFQVQSLTKALEKQLGKIKEPQLMAILEKRAERMYGGDIAKVLKDGEALAGSMEKGRVTIMAHEVLTQSMINLYPRYIKAYKAKVGNISKEEMLQFQNVLEKVFLNTAEIRTRWGQIGKIFQWGKDTALGFDDLGIKFKNLTTEYKAYGEDFDVFLDKMSLIKDTKSIPQVLRWVGRNRTWAVLNEVWINALLSSPKTHLINMTSNLINTFIRPLEVGLGSRLGSKLMENPAKIAAMRAQGREAVTVFAGLFRYLDDVMTYTKLAFKNEDTVISGRGGRTKIDTPAKAVGGKLGAVIRTPTRFLNAEDEFFKQINGRAKLYQLAVKDAIEQGKSIDTVVGTNIRTRKAITEFEAHVANFERRWMDESNTVIIHPDAMKYMEEATFTQNLHGISKSVQDLVNKYPILKQAMPFVRTPFNLFKATVDRIPVAGLLRKEFRDDFLGLSGNPYRMAEARGKQAIGFTIMTMATTVFKDRIQGGEPTSEYTTKLPKDLKDLAKTATNFVPYSILIGDHYYGFGRLDPFGAIVGIIADYNRYYDKLTEEELLRIGNGTNVLLWKKFGENKLPTSEIAMNIASASWSGIVRNAFSKTYLQSLMELVKIVTSDDEYTAKKWFRNKLGSYIPNFYTKLVNDPYFRDVRSILDNIKKRTGVEVQVKYNFRGEPLKYSGNFNDRIWRTMVNPLGRTPIKEDVVAEEVLRLGQNITPFKKFFKGTAVDLTQFQNPKTGQNAYDMLQEFYRDTGVNARIKKLITSKAYKTLTDPISIDEKSGDKGQKFEAIMAIIKESKTIAESKLYNKLTTLQHIKDKKLSALVSYKRAVYNKNYYKSGGRDEDALYPLYTFSKN